jgi:hypothetical protein
MTLCIDFEVYALLHHLVSDPGRKEDQQRIHEEERDEEVQPVGKEVGQDCLHLHLCHIHCIHHHIHHRQYCAQSMK